MRVADLANRLKEVGKSLNVVQAEADMLRQAQIVWELLSPSAVRDMKTMMEPIDALEKSASQKLQALKEIIDRLASKMHLDIARHNVDPTMIGGVA